MEEHLRYRPLPEVCAANVKPVATLCTVNMPIILADFIVNLGFTVCDPLASGATLYTVYCNGFVESIRLCAKFPEDSDGIDLPTVCRPFRSSATPCLYQYPGSPLKPVDVIHLT